MSEDQEKEKLFRRFNYIENEEKVEEINQRSR
jgi:hypothetical protein